MNGRYAEYLKTPHWRALRDEKLAAADYRCERCGEFGRRGLGGVWLGLNVHHLSYKNVGHEPLSDLEVLCIACHEDAHDIPHGSNRREEIRHEIAKRVTGRACGWAPEDELDIYNGVIA